MFINLYLYHFNQLQEMSELETDDIVDSTDVDYTNQDYSQLTEEQAL